MTLTWTPNCAVSTSSSIIGPDRMHILDLVQVIKIFLFTRAGIDEVAVGRENFGDYCGRSVHSSIALKVSKQEQRTRTEPVRPGTDIDLCDGSSSA